MGGCSKPVVYIPRGSQVIVTYDMTPRLQSGELLTGTPTVTDSDSTGDLTISNKQINTVADAENDIEIGKAVQFMISTSATSCKDYELDISVDTDSTPAQTLADKLAVSFHD